MHVNSAGWFSVPNISQLARVRPQDPLDASPSADPMTAGLLQLEVGNIAHAWELLEKAVRRAPSAIFVAASAADSAGQPDLVVHLFRVAEKQVPTIVSEQRLRLSMDRMHAWSCNHRQEDVDVAFRYAKESENGVQHGWFGGALQAMLERLSYRKAGVSFADFQQGKGRFWWVPTTDIVALHASLNEVVLASTKIPERAFNSLETIVALCHDDKSKEILTTDVVPTLVTFIRGNSQDASKASTVQSAQRSLSKILEISGD